MPWFTDSNQQEPEGFNEVAPLLPAAVPFGENGLAGYGLLLSMA
jgi:hypothetical protein